jgi:1,4-alpha-glucan branching enzyme
LEAFRAPAGEGRIALMTSAATHAVLPLLATRGGRRLQIDAGLRSHRRRFGAPVGFWLPECAYEPGLEALLAERDLPCFIVDQSGHERPLAALAPVATQAGPVALPIDWEAVSWLWAPGGYPSHPVHADSFRASSRGLRLWSIEGGAYDPARAASMAREQAERFAAAVAQRLRAFRAERGRPGLLIFAIDTELLGHWWREGPTWLAEAIQLAPGHGIDLVTLPEALERHEPEARPLRASSWGEGKDLRTWDSRDVADLAWGARRLEMRLVRALADERPAATSRMRAARELLAIQSSDWAFLDQRGQAGDYPFQRVTAHAESLLEAIHSRRPSNPGVRSLAPDLSLSPLMEP